MPSPITWLQAWSDQHGGDLVRDVFREAFGEPAPPVWAAPGRVNLIGEHTDYNAGLCLPMALPHRTFAAVRPRADGLIRLVSAQQPGAIWSGQLAQLAPGRVDGWAGYAAGVAWALAKAGHEMTGFEAAIDSCVPLGAGLSSSAALESAIAVALDELCGLGLVTSDDGRAQLAAACVCAENEIAGAPTGGMDQAASLRSPAGHALLLDFRHGLDPLRMATPLPLDLTAADRALLVIDTRAPHRLVDGQYAARRLACEEAARVLGRPTLREVADELAGADGALGVGGAGAGGPEPSGGGISVDSRNTGDAGALEAVLAALPDEVTRRRVRHVITEIDRVRQVADQLRRGAIDEIGPIFDESHRSLRDDYEVSCPELDLAVGTAREAGALGARMTGGGFGGSAIALLPTAEAPAVAEAVRDAFSRARFAAPAFLTAVPSAPAGRAD